jgi:hypothetical protein
MTLEQLQRVAKGYIDGKVSEDRFYVDILAFLDEASPGDYMAFAEWLLKQGKEH